MTKEIAKKIAKGITDKIECNTADIDDWAEFWGFTSDDYKEFLDMAIKASEQEPINYKAQYEKFSKKTEIVISQLRTDRDRLLDILDKIRSEISENTFSVVNPKNTYEYINVLDLGNIEEIIDKYKKESEK